MHGCDYASPPTSVRSSTRVDANKPVSVSQPPSLWVSVMREESNERRLGLVIKRPTGAEEILTHHPFRTADTDRPAEGGTRKERGRWVGIRVEGGKGMEGWAELKRKK